MRGILFASPRSLYNFSWAFVASPGLLIITFIPSVLTPFANWHLSIAFEMSPSASNTGQETGGPVSGTNLANWLRHLHGGGR